MKIKYNAPVTLTFSFLCVFILLLKTLFFPNIIEVFFTVPAHSAFQYTEPLKYSALVLHIFGHFDWNHLLGNLSFILLLGPMLEESYGSVVLAVMMIATALVTGVLNVCFSPQSLLGSSGIAFMMILLCSFANTTKREIPMSFLLIFVLYLVKDVIQVFESDNIAHFAHWVGGLTGSLFGYFRPVVKRSRNTSKAKTSNVPVSDEVHE